MEFKKIYKLVPALSDDSVEYTVPSGYKIHLRELVCQAAIGSVVVVAKDYGEETEEIIVSTHGSLIMKDFAPVVIPANSKITIVLINNNNIPTYLGGQWAGTLML